MDKIDPNHDLVPTLRMMDGLLFDRAADEIEKWRDAYRKAVQTPAAELMVVGPGWHERFPVITAPIVIDGLLQVHVSDRRDDMADELTRLRAENAALIAERAAPQQAEPTEIVPRVWREALRKLTFMARTSGVSAGPDEGLKAACAEAETLLSKPYNYPPAAPQQAEPRIVFHLHEPVMTIEVEQDADGRYSVTVPTEFPGLPVGKHALYLHPPPDEVQRLRDSASALCGALTASELNDRAYHALNKLHRALEGK